jgi:hypothetical protein
MTGQALAICRTILEVETTYEKYKIGTSLKMQDNLKTF